jgi:gliding motility-associated-like protein
MFTSFKNCLSMLKKGKKQMVLFAIFFILVNHAMAQIPLNDDPCTNPIIPGSGAITLVAAAACTYSTFTNIDASNSTAAGIPNPSCANFTGGDVWFKVVVPTGATAVTVDTRNIGLTDGAMAIYTATGTCPTLTMTEIACIDDGSTNPSMPKLTVNQPAGTTLYVRIWGFGGETGTFGICVTANIPPANDNCTTAQSLTVNANLLCGVVTAGTTNNATQSSNTPVPPCGLANAWDDDVWYSFVATGVAHRVSLLNIAGGSTNMTMNVYSGTCAALVQVGCINGNTLDIGGLVTGTTYYVRVYTNVVSTATATFNICVGTPPPPPPNDECPNAVSLTVNPTYTCTAITSGTTVSATQSANLPAPGCSSTGINDDVWFKFIATGAGHRISLSNVAPVNTMGITVYSGTCAALAEVGCSTTGVLNLTGLTAGTTYIVRIFTTSNVVGTTSAFDICVGTPPPPPVNDECLNAVSLTVNPDFNCAIVTGGTTVSATQSANLPAPGCSSAGINDDVWYKFTTTATSTAHRITLTGITPVNAMGITAYSGTCGSLAEIGCSTTGVLNLAGLTPNTTYIVRVFTTSATAFVESNFNICVGTPPPPPVNDNCANAIVATVNPNYLCGTVTAGTTTSATLSTVPAPTCSATGIDDDVWFSFVATNASQRISLLNIVGTTTALTSVVYGGTCAALTQISCNTTNLYNVTGFTVGSTYYIRIFTTTATIAQEVNFNLCIGTPPPPPTNDECIGAISLTVNANQLCGVTTAGTTSGATQSATTPTPTCSAPNGWDDDVWFSFVAVSNNHTVSLLNVTGLTTDMLTTVYSGTCGNLIQIACATIDPNVINLSTLTPGNTYYVRVQTELTGLDANFSICIGTPGPGAVCSSGNPFCSTSGVVYPSVTGQPSLGGGGIFGCLGSTPNPTWFVFQVSSPGNLVFQVSQTNTAGTGIDVDYAAWGPFTSQADGCTQLGATPSSQTPISCSYSTAAVETITIPNAVVGQWYVVLITNFNGGAGTISFNTTTGNVGSTNCNIVCNTVATNNGPVCTGGTFNLTASALSGATTYAWTGPGGFTSTAQNPIGIVAPNVPGNYVYNVTTTSGSVTCSASTNLIVVTTPVAPIVVSPVTYCQGATATALTATALTNHTLLWYTAPTGGVGSAIAPIPSTATIGSTTYYVSQKIGQCEGPRAAIVVNITASTTPAIEVISPVNYCQGATAVSLAGNTLPITGATVLWYTAATGGTGSTTAPIPSTTTSGSTTYYVSQMIGTCEGPRVGIIVNVTAYSPSPTVTSPVAYCQGATATALVATGTNLLWYTVATGGTGTATAPIPSTATAGTTIYYVTQTTNGCASLRVSVTVNVTANPTTPVVVSPVVYCQGTTAVPLTATGTNLTWYTVPTGGTALAGAPTPSTTTVGNTIYYVQANNGICVSPRASITVTVNATPLAPTVTSPVTYCQLATAVALTATGTNLLWYTTPTGGTGSTTAPTPITTTVGTTNYYVSSTIGTCEGPRALIAVIVNGTPLAPTVTTPVNYCQNVTASALTATPNIGTLLWYTTATGGTGTTIAPTPSTATAGSVTYYVSAILGTCEGPRTPLVVTVIATPALPAVTTPVTYCTNVTAVPLTATGTNLLWYTTAIGGTGSTTAPTPSTATAGTTPYYVTQSTSGVVCEGPRALINVVVNPRPAAPTVVTPLAYCQNFNAPVLTATGTNLLWYNVATGGTGTATAPTPSTLSVGSTSYYVSQSALTCEGARSTIVVNVSPALNVNAGVDRIIARGDQVQLAGTSTSVGATYLWTSSTTPLALTSAIILNPIANPIFTTIYTLRVSDPTGLCPSVTDDVKIDVVQSCINIKNAFTPNGDGINETWFVYDQNFCLTNPGGAKVTVFNRYGSKVYESKDYTNNWDGTYNGKPLPDGTYYAVIEFTLFDGSKQYKKTDVTILR